MKEIDFALEFLNKFKEHQIEKITIEVQGKNGNSNVFCVDPEQVKESSRLLRQSKED